MQEPKSFKYTEKPFLLVTGMHRSGTSMLMRLCSLLGVEIGNKLVPPLPNDNETGFWEHEKAVIINETLLEAFGTTHLGVDKLPAEWPKHPAAIQALENIAQTVATDFARFSKPGIKDPRISRLLPLWIQAISRNNCRPHVILSLRNPLEVAQSLHKRNKISVEQGLELWLLYNLEAEYYSRAVARACVYYPALLQDWEGTLSRAFQTSQMGWSDPGTQARDVINGFMRPDLRHNNVTDEQTKQSVSPMIWQVFMALRQAASGDGFNADLLDTARRKLALDLPRVQFSEIPQSGGLFGWWRKWCRKCA